MRTWTPTTTRTPGARAPNLENAHNTYPIIEFIHYGYVHHTHTNLFPHDDFQDDKKDDSVTDGAKPRAIQFRSALEREAILLATFMQCTQTVLDDARQERRRAGGTGQSAQRGGQLVRRGWRRLGQDDREPTSTSHIQAVVDATSPVLPDTITYTNVHKCRERPAPGAPATTARHCCKRSSTRSRRTSDTTGGLMGTVTGFRRVGWAALRARWRTS